MGKHYRTLAAMLASIEDDNRRDEETHNACLLFEANDRRFSPDGFRAAVALRRTEIVTDRVIASARSAA